MGGFTMVTFIMYFNLLILCLFFACYAYQLVFVLIRFFVKDKKHTAKKQHKFAVLISARNESSVIANLLESIHAQHYPKELLDIIVVADNCTDNTADIARQHGATVYERFNHNQVGKGYALDYAFSQIEKSVGIDHYEGYFVFDADNILDENFVAEMNNVFDEGYNVLTSYRNSKNYDSNWISAGYALWFLRESKYLNGARMICHSSCAISGTGFLVSSKIIQKNHGWKHHLLTEDIEFSVDSIVHGEVIGYCENAILYDEQPIRFKEAWNQRLRWAKGFYQVFANYGKNLIKGCFTGRRFQCYDMLMTIAPATLLTLLTVFVNGGFLLSGLLTGNEAVMEMSTYQVCNTIFSVYCSLFLFGTITTITEWKQIHSVWYKKIMYLFTFPIFMFTYIPIAICALFKKVQWTPIQHSVCKNLQQIRQ